MTFHNVIADVVLATGMRPQCSHFCVSPCVARYTFRAHWVWSFSGGHSVKINESACAADEHGSIVEICSAFASIGAMHAKDKSIADAMMHRTATIDYLIVLKGEIWAILD
jgi:hypothetical protein